MEIHENIVLFWEKKNCRSQLKCDGTRAETRFRLAGKRTSLFKSVGASVQSTTGNRGVRISGSNAGYIMFRGSVKGVGYPLHSPVSLSLLLPWITVWHHISTGVYQHEADYETWLAVAENAGTARDVTDWLKQYISSVQSRSNELTVTGCFLRS